MGLLSSSQEPLFSYHIWALLGNERSWYESPDERDGEPTLRVFGGASKASVLARRSCHRRPFLSLPAATTTPEPQLSLPCLLIYKSVAVIPIMWEPCRRAKNGPCTLRTKLFFFFWGNPPPSTATTTTAPPGFQGLRGENPKPSDLNAQRSPALQNLLP